MGFYCFYRSKRNFHRNYNRDEELWEQNMLPKLVNFYNKYILKELADPRIPRDLKIRGDEL